MNAHVVGILLRNEERLVNEAKRHFVMPKGEVKQRCALTAAQSAARKTFGSARTRTHVQRRVLRDASLTPPIVLERELDVGRVGRCAQRLLHAVVKVLVQATDSACANHSEESDCCRAQVYLVQRARSRPSNSRWSAQLRYLRKCVCGSPLSESSIVCASSFTFANGGFCARSWSCMHCACRNLRRTSGNERRRLERAKLRGAAPLQLRGRRDPSLAGWLLEIGLELGERGRQEVTKSFGHLQPHRGDERQELCTRLVSTSPYPQKQQKRDSLLAAGTEAEWWREIAPRESESRSKSASGEWRASCTARGQCWRQQVSVAAARRLRVSVAQAAHHELALEVRCGSPQTNLLELALQRGKGRLVEQRRLHVELAQQPYA